MALSLTLLTLNLSLLLIFKHPLVLVLSLVGQTLSLILLIYQKSENPWISIIIFLIFLGGLLIIFTYLAALIPNEIFFTNKWGSIMLMMPSMSTLYLTSNQNMMYSAFMQHMSNQHNFTLIPCFLAFIMLTLCVLMFLCLKMKTPIKQENY